VVKVDCFEFLRRRIVPRWGVRFAKPGGVALQRWVGSTPTLFRHVCGSPQKPNHPSDKVFVMTAASPPATRPPSIDALMARPALQALAQTHGRQATLKAAREALAAWRDNPDQAFNVDGFDANCSQTLVAQSAMHLRPVFNMTGTVLHTNLGRAVSPPEVIDAVAAVMSQASNLEYDLDRGARGDRDDAIEALLCELTGAQAATAVNNNAAAVMLVLSALANKKEVPVSRGELVEIGGAFRVPDIMRRAGAKLLEVGTTNRTHLRDFDEGITARTGLVMKIHTSNYVIQGFTASVPIADLAALCQARGVPFAEDLGAGSLVDMTRWGLPAEPTPQASIAAGVNVVTFSGDKLLGGPQAGLIVGDKALIDKIKKCPLKRALRLDKMTMAALEATLKLYRDPDRLAQRLPTLRLLTRSADDMQSQALRVADAMTAALGAQAQVIVQPCRSQIGSGSLPVDRLDGFCVSLQAAAGSKRAGSFPDRLSRAMRRLPVPVVGRIEDGQLRLDVRCIDGASQEATLLKQIALLMDAKLH
jgi:L-seryl-tRNA(Ser) seleniumtransferase